MVDRITRFAQVFFTGVGFCDDSVWSFCFQLCITSSSFFGSIYLMVLLLVQSIMQLNYNQKFSHPSLLSLTCPPLSPSLCKPNGFANQIMLKTANKMHDCLWNISVCNKLNISYSQRSNSHCNLFVNQRTVEWPSWAFCCLFHSYW